MSAPSADVPRVDVACFGPGLALAVARVEIHAAGHAAIASQWLCGAEHARSVRFKVDHARADFLAGRIAAKTAARALASGLSAASAWEILPGEHQQPLIAHVVPGHALSLAHAGGVGLALVHDAHQRCGIDLEPVGRDAGDAIATQVAPSEAAWARAGGAEERVRWLLLWTAREAQGKSFGTGLLEPAHLATTAQWAPVAHGWRARVVGDETVVVRAVVAGGFVVSFVVPVGVDADAMAAWLAAALV